MSVTYVTYRQLHEKFAKENSRTGDHRRKHCIRHTLPHLYDSIIFFISIAATLLALMPLPELLQDARP